MFTWTCLSQFLFTVLYGKSSGSKHPVSLLNVMFSFKLLPVKKFVFTEAK